MEKQKQLRMILSIVCLERIQAVNVYVCVCACAVRVDLHSKGLHKCDTLFASCLSLYVLLATMSKHSINSLLFLLLSVLRIDVGRWPV